LKPARWMDEHCHAFILESIINVLPPEFPNLRELKIQIAKWQRLLLAPREVRAFHLLGMRPSAVKKWRKEEGHRDARALQQGKNVKRLLEDSFKQYLKDEWPMNGTRYTNKRFAEWRAKMHKGIGQSKDRMKVEVSKRTVHLMSGGTSKYHGWAKRMG
jgi:hypothetical protein